MDEEMMKISSLLAEYKKWCKKNKLRYEKFKNFQKFMKLKESEKDVVL